MQLFLQILAGTFQSSKFFHVQKGADIKEQTVHWEDYALEKARRRRRRRRRRRHDACNSPSSDTLASDTTLFGAKKGFGTIGTTSCPKECHRRRLFLIAATTVTALATAIK